MSGNMSMKALRERQERRLAQGARRAAYQAGYTPTQLAHEHRIYGPPGTGKTETLRLIVSELAQISPRILVASFTRTAAANLVHRSLDVDTKYIHTLHSFGYTALGQANYKGIAEEHIEEWNDEQSAAYAMSAVRGDTGEMFEDGASGRAQRKTDADLLFAHLSLLRARMEPESFWPHNVLAFGRAWTAWKERHGYIDFADMVDLPRLRKLPPPHEPVFGVFDEAQDFTPAEMALVRHWGAMMERYYLAGDDDQAIFAFKGGDVRAFIYPLLPPEQCRHLTQSYRVPAAVQSYATGWIERVKERVPKTYAPRKDAAGAVIVGGVRNFGAEWGRSGVGAKKATYKAPEALVDEMERYLALGKSVMVLATCSYMLRPTIEVLKARGLPFQNQYNPKRNDWNPLNIQSGISASARLCAFLRLSEAVWGEHGARLWTIDELLMWLDALKIADILYHGAKKEMERLRDEWEQLDPQRVKQDLDIATLAQWFRPDALQAAISQDIDWFERHLTAKKVEGMRYPLTVARKRGAKLLLDPAQITVGTIHSVKGGQADVVILFPDLSYAGFQEWNDHEGKDTIARTFYVGMTRAFETLLLAPAADELCVSFPTVRADQRGILNTLTSMTTQTAS